MGFPLKDPLPGQFDYILQDIRAGVTYPDFWMNRYGEDDEPEQECTYTRSWETVTDGYPPIEQASRTRRQG